METETILNDQSKVEQLVINGKPIISVKITDLKTGQTYIVNEIRDVAKIFHICCNAIDKKEGSSGLDQSVYQERKILIEGKIIVLDMLVSLSDGSPIIFQIEFIGKKKKKKQSILIIFSITQDNHIRDSLSLTYYHSENICRKINLFIYKIKNHI